MRLCSHCHQERGHLSTCPYYGLDPMGQDELETQEFNESFSMEGRFWACRRCGAVVNNRRTHHNYHVATNTLIALPEDDGESDIFS